MSTLGSRLDALATKSATRVTRTRWFRRAVSRAFRAVDHDESGALTLKEANGAVGCLYVEIAKVRQMISSGEEGAGASGGGAAARECPARR